MSFVFVKFAICKWIIRKTIGIGLLILNFLHSEILACYIWLFLQGQMRLLFFLPLGSEFSHLLPTVTDHQWTNIFQQLFGIPSFGPEILRKIHCRPIWSNSQWNSLKIRFFLVGRLSPNVTFDNCKLFLPIPGPIQDTHTSVAQFRLYDGIVMI